MKQLLTENNATATDSFDSFNENLHCISGLNSTLKKCQSLITLQRIMILRSNSNYENNEKEKKDLEKHFVMDIDITKKQNP